MLAVQAVQCHGMPFHGWCSLLLELSDCQPKGSTVHVAQLPLSSPL